MEAEGKGEEPGGGRRQPLDSASLFGKSGSARVLPVCIETPKVSSMIIVHYTVICLKQDNGTHYSFNLDNSCMFLTIENVTIFQ